ncbi:NAD(P)-dependent oxidoreductase [Pricia sp. S334]|uniref:NAD(P)-dependent oxidoreductase n=1 Tax=Pricia mediterranea TaxID=3076079 RepID=A0ABU3LAW9_9FLAO|nr:NAD(P)-dependent oxidoreductase [Pricia sp. S334]MDT7830548.1 NAD(P)-dependent oxidoreductase [Pricia sp. S334]
MKTIEKKILVTGATGKVGHAFTEAFLADPNQKGTLRALCHKRSLTPNDRLEVMHGSISDHTTVQKAVKDITHVIHLATPKEDAETIMDVAIKGLFWLLESCRKSGSFKRFILIGGDASVGHYFYPHKNPITEEQDFTAYPGCYALSKVLEETMLRQYFVQYDLDGTCLRAPWIMQGDDLRRHLSFEKEVFGVPEWYKMVDAQTALEYQKENKIPLMLDANGNPMKRNMVHLNDLVSAMIIALDHKKAKQQTFNIAMDRPFDYGKAADYLLDTQKVKSVKAATDYHSTWLDNSKAKFLLGWQPKYGLEQMLDDAWGDVTL